MDLISAFRWVNENKLAIIPVLTVSASCCTLVYASLFVIRCLRGIDCCWETTDPVMRLFYKVKIKHEKNEGIKG